MKEELKVLKELVKEYDKLYGDFYDKRTLFNLRVDELCEDYDCVLYPVGITEEQFNNQDSYDNAKAIFNSNSGIIARLNNIKKLNTDADRRKLISLYIRCLSKNYGLDYDTAYYFVSNYIVFTEAGYYKTVKSENIANNSLRRISNQVEILKTQGLNSMENTIESAKNKAFSTEQEVMAKLEPYATEVKRGFNTVMDKAKPYVHDGSKGLAKVFTKIADRTRPTDNEKK